MDKKNLSAEELFALTEKLEKKCKELEAQSAEYKAGCEEAIRRQQLLQNLLDAIPDVISYKNASGEYLEFNKSFAELVGHEKQNIYGKSDNELFPDDAYNYASKRDKIILESNTIRLFEEIERLPDGNRIILSTTKIPYTDEDNNAGIIGISRDVTEQKKSQMQLIDQATFVNKNPAPVFKTLGDGTIVNANPKAKNIFGKNIEGQTIKSILPSITDEIIEEIKTAEQYQLEEVIGDRNILFTIKEDPSTNSCFFYGSDITEKRMAEEQLLLQGQVMESAANGIMITDSDGKIIWVNPAFSELTGFSTEEVNGQTPSILKSGEHPAAFYKELWQTILSGEVWTGEMINKRKDGSLYYENMTVTPVKSLSGKISHFVSIKEDITRRKKDEEELEKHRNHLQQLVDERTSELLDKNLELKKEIEQRIKIAAELIEAKNLAEKSDRLKTEFLAQMSHEIRTPINSILSFTSLIKFDIEDHMTEDLKESFHMIENGSKRLIRTIDLIINMSELQTGSFSMIWDEIGLQEVLEPLVHEYSIVAEEQKLQFNFENKIESAKTIRGDRYTLTQIFSNLLDNAVKYTPEGSVSVSLYENDNNEYCFEVKDTGIGISEEYQQDIFDPFSQEDQGYTRKFEGNGLGLAIVKRFCDLNNAIVELESEKGKGSIFRIILK